MKKVNALLPRKWPTLALAAMFAIGSVAPSVAATAADFMEHNTNRHGGDFRVFASGPQGPRHCASECAADNQCKAWTYVAMGNEGPNATCHLKLVVPPAQNSPCCISGVTIGSGTHERRTGY